MARPKKTVKKVPVKAKRKYTRRIKQVALKTPPTPNSVNSYRASLGLSLLPEPVATVKQEPEPEFIHTDWRKENPGLHALYVKSAVRHLCMIDRMLQEVHNCSNLNLSELWLVINAQREKLLRTNTAYQDAQDILLEHQYGRTGKRPKGYGEVPEES